jgi:hypothetical protein
MATDNNGEELITLSDAAELLGVNRMKITRLLKAGLLTVAGVDPLDLRSKLVRRSDVEALARRSAKKVAA